VRPSLLALLGAVAAVVIALDQLTKTWALHALANGPKHLWWRLRFVLALNSGAAFSMGTGVTPFVIAGVVVMLAVLLFISRSVSSRPAAIALGLVLGGALGNLTDRLVRHNHRAVIDFVDFRPWPTFNVADAAVVCGAILLVLTGAEWGRRHTDTDAGADAGA
jgi:signal peptidase II